MPESRLEKTRNAYPPCAICGHQFAVVGDLCADCANSSAILCVEMEDGEVRVAKRYPLEPDVDNLWGV